jgi:hypothetical protein
MEGTRLMQRVEIEELRERAAELLTGTEALSVERQGQPVGVYLPVPRTLPRDAQDSMTTLRAAVAAALAQGQISAEELADLFDLRHPVP